MAELLDSMPKVKRAGRKKKYNLTDQFKQDKPFRLTPGTTKEVEADKADFDCSHRTMRHNLYRISKAEGIRLETVTEVKDGKETIVAQVIERNGKPVKRTSK